MLLRRALATGDSNLGVPHQPRLSPDTRGGSAGRRALGRAQLGKPLARPNARATSPAGAGRRGACCPPTLCACGSGLTLPCAELSPGFPRESSSGSSAGKEREWWKGKLGFPLSLPTLAAAFSPLGGICSWQQQRRRQPRHPSHAPRRQGPRGWPGGRRDRGEPADGVPGPQSCAGNLPWKSLLLHPGHFKRRWRQTARGCRPDNKPPLFRRCSDLWRWQVSKKCPAGPSLQVDEAPG